MGQGRFGLKDGELLEIAKALVYELEGRGKNDAEALGHSARLPEKKPVEGPADFGPKPSVEALRQVSQTGFQVGATQRPVYTDEDTAGFYPRALRAGHSGPMGRRPVLRRQEKAASFPAEDRTAYVGHTAAGPVSGAELEAETENTSEPDLEKLSAGRLSEAFRRDARRYDARFERY